MTTVQFALPARRRMFTGLVAASASAALLAGCGSSNSNSGASSPPAGAATSTPAAASPTATTTAGAKAVGKAEAKAKALAGGGAAATQAKAKAVKATVLKLKADPTGKLMFIPTKLTAKAGRVTLIMTNPSGSGVPHGVSLKGNGVDVDGAPTTPGGTSTVTATLQPGTYQYYCPVPGHAAAGMVGTLTIT